MSIVVRLSPTNVTRENYDEVARRLESAECGQIPMASSSTFSSGQRGTSASARSGTLESSSRPSASIYGPSSPMLELVYPLNQRFSRCTTSSSGSKSGSN